MAGGIAVLRIDTVRHMNTHLADHLRGINRPSTATPEPPRPVVDPHVVVEGEATVLGLAHSFKCDVPGSAEAVRESRNARKRQGQKGGRPPNEAVMILLAGPPPYGTLEQWPDDMELKWAKASDAWARTVFGKGPVFVSCLHRDETSPHLHVTGVPVCGGRISWNARLAELMPKVAARDRYRALQDSYHETVGKKFGLARGVPGSKAAHTKPQRQKDDEQAALAAKETRDRLEAELVEKRAESKALADAIAAGKKGWRGKAKERGLALLDELAAERAGRRAERERADAAEEKLNTLQIAYDFLAKGRDRSYKELDSAYTYVCKQLSMYVDRFMGDSKSAPAVRLVAGEMDEWAKTRFSDAWVSPIAVKNAAKNAAAVVREAAHDAPAVHQGRDQGSGL